MPHNRLVGEVDVSLLAVWGLIAAGVMGVTAFSYLAYRRRNAASPP